MIPLAWSILWVPFLAMTVIWLFLLRRPRLAAWTATGGLFVSFALSCVLLLKIGIPETPLEAAVPWVTLPGLEIEFGVLLNGLTLLMLLIVTGVGSLIFLYSQEYMEHEKGVGRYYAFLSLFAFSMLGIVLANNFIQLFIFWELVGLSSYLLIGYWYEKPEASDAGKKAFLTTRAGDVGFLLGILLLFGWLQAGGEGTFNFLRIEGLLAGIRDPTGVGATHASALQILTAVGLLIFLGVMGKSAQFPLHVWLPDAMEGPTPVSALIHAATMVAAGVFLLARLFFLFSLSPPALTVIASLGTLTALLAAAMAFVQNDIKRVLAYSTLSQLGFMVAGLGLSNSQAGMFHLSTHAFFKALLFLGAGSVIHKLHTQDIRQMSGLLRKMPVTGWTFLAGTLALAGIFPFAGFWSKELILGTAYVRNPSLFGVLLLTTFLTAAYMGRLFAVAFLGKETGGKPVKDPSWKMKLPLLVLAFFSLAGGFLPLRELVGPADELHAPWQVTAWGLAAGIVGFLVTLFLYRLRPAWVVSLGKTARLPKRVLEKKFYMDDFYEALIRHVQDRLARLSDLFERYVVVEFYVNGTARSVRFAGDLARKLQTGQVQFYALLFSIGLTLLTYGLLLWNR